MRAVDGLKWAREAESPWGKRQRVRGAKAKGLAYERALAKALPGATHGQWFEFEDRNGRGYCQPDLILCRGLLLEAKYTWTIDGHRQIEGLYKPVLEKVYGVGWIGIVVCKVLVAGMPRGVKVVGDLAEGVREARAGNQVVLHWIGMGSVPFNAPAKAGHPLSPSPIDPTTLGL